MVYLQCTLWGRTVLLNIFIYSNSWKTLTGICDHIRTRVLLKILRYITTPRIPNEAKYLTIIDGCWSDFRIFHFTETQNI